MFFNLSHKIKFKKLIWIKYLFNEKSNINGNQLINLAIIEKITPIDKT